MKNNSFLSFLCVGALCAAAVGCAPAPKIPPMGDSNAPALGEPLSIEWKSYLMQEKKVPLQVRVTDLHGASALTSALSAMITGAQIKATDDPRIPYDIQVSLKSSSRELTAAPSCRMLNRVEIFTAAYGVEVIRNWSVTTENQQPCPTRTAAEGFIFDQVKENLRNWNNDLFTPAVKDLLQVSVVRFSAAADLIEIFPAQDREIREITSAIRSLPGVINVRLIEDNRELRLVSFRVLFRRDKMPAGVAKALAARNK